MRMNPRVAGGIALAIGLFGLVVFAFVRGVWLAPRAALLEQRTELREQVARLMESRERLRTTEARVASVVGATLGADMQTVDHRLRTRLNRIAEDAGVAGAVVGTGGHAVRMSPARSSMPRGGEWARLRDEPDFAELSASLNGEGTLTQVIEVLDRIEAEPWIKRVDSVRIEPRDGGERFGLAVRLTTIYLPGRGPESIEWPAWDPARLARLQPVIEGNPFRVPPPPPEPEPVRVARERPRPATPPPPPPPPPFPWGDWVLTGVAAQSGEEEAWIRNRRSGETRRLAPGEALDAAELTVIEHDAAHFRMPDGIVRIEVGRSFAERVRVGDAGLSR